MSHVFKKSGARIKKLPGVRRIDDEHFRVRAEYTCPKSGKRREIDKIVIAPSADDAAAMRRELLAAAKAATVPAKRIRLGDFAASWAESCARRLKKSTCDHYAETLDLYIAPDPKSGRRIAVNLGEMYLDAITHEDVEAWFKSQKGTKQTINGRLRILRALLKSASKAHTIPNPAAAVAEHRIVRGEDDHKVIEPKKLVEVLAWLRENTTYYPIALTLALTGMRYSEAAGLKFADVNFEKRTIRVVRRWYRGDLDTPKNGRARTIAIPAELVRVLRARRREAGEGAEWVFASKQTGTPVRQVGLASAMARAGRAVGLKQRPTPHSFRYSWSDLLRRATTGEVQRAMTGHSSIAMAEHYSHVAVTEKLAAVDAAMLLLGSISGEKSGEGVEADAMPGTSLSAIELH